MSESTRSRSRASGADLPAAYFALLFFFGCADLSFANRIWSMNFRWAQLLLLAGAAATAISLAIRWNKRTSRDRNIVTVLAFWLLFFGTYGLSVVTSPEPKAGLIKLVWGIVNISGAALVCLGGSTRKSSVMEGIAVGCALVSCVIWVDMFAMYWLDMPGPVIGGAQSGYTFQQISLMRPSAFYYEPSYAGAMLSFATPMLFVATETLPLWAGLTIPALAISATILAGSRTGFVSLFLAIALSAAWALWQRRWKILGRIGTAFAVACVALAIFSSAPRASVYRAYLAGPLGFAASAQRLVHNGESGAPTLEARTSEGSRVASALSGIHQWRSHPLFGAGVNNGGMRAVGGNEADRSIHTSAPNTWIEVLVESGLLGISAFVLAIVMSLRTALISRPRNPLWGLLVAACLAHFAINLNMTQTFPRLDYWLLFFCVIRAALAEVPATAQSDAKSPAAANSRSDSLPQPVQVHST